MYATFFVAFAATFVLASAIMNYPNLQQGDLSCNRVYNQELGECIAPGRIVEAWVANEATGKCRVHRTFGFMGNVLWVKGDCSGTFTLVYQTSSQYTNTPNPTYPPGTYPNCQDGDVNTVCLSTGFDRRVCRVPVVISRVTVRQSVGGFPVNGACQLNVGYGISQNQSAIWTNRGCQGIFDVSYQVCPVGTQIGCRPYTGTVRCGNGGFFYTECSVPIEVTAVRVQSSGVPFTNQCVENVSYGRERDGVWVTQGCRGYFNLRYRVCTECPTTDGCGSYQTYNEIFGGFNCVMLQRLTGTGERIDTGSHLCIHGIY